MDAPWTEAKPGQGLRGLLLSVLLLVFALPCQGSSSVEAVLRSRRPQDVKALYGKARAWLAEGRHGDAEAVARYLLHDLGRKHHKIHNLLGLALHRQGRADEAAAAFEASLASRPGNPMATRALARLKGRRGDRPDIGPNLLDGYCGPLVGEAKRARALVFADRWAEALPLVAKLHEANPDDLAVALLQVQLLQDTARGDEARVLMDRLLKAHPENVAVLALDVELLTGAQKIPQALAGLDRALLLAPDHPTLLRKKAILLTMSNRGDEADVLWKKLRPSGQDPGLLGRQDEVLYLYLRGEIDECVRTLEAIRTHWGESSDLRLLQGLVHFKKGERDEAIAALSDAYMRNPKRLSFLTTVIPMFVALGANHDAVALIEKGNEHYPNHPVIQALARRAIVSTVQEHMMTATLVGPFQIRYPQSMPQPLLQLIAALFRQAYDELCPVFQVRPEVVQLDVTLVPNSRAAATYSIADDKINVAAVYFRPDPGSLATCRHIVRHEFVHLLHAHRMRAAGVEPAFKLMPLWLIEGVAEHYSGGIDAQRVMGFDARKVFRPTVESSDPTMAFADLNACLGVGGAGARSSQAEKFKSYAQACKMVEYLASTRAEGKDVDALVDFTVRLLRSGDLQACLQASFGLSVTQFNEGWKNRLSAWASQEP